MNPIPACKEHIEIALEEWVNLHAISADLESIEHCTENGGHHCFWCTKPATYLILATTTEGKK